MSSMVLISLWTAPLQLFLIIYQLVSLLGVSAWISFSLLLFSLLVTFAGGVLVGPLFAILFETDDTRVTITREAVYGMEVIKYRALEEFMQAKVLAIFYL